MEPSIEETYWQPPEYVTRISYLHKGREDYPEMEAAITKLKKKLKAQVFNRLDYLASLEPHHYKVGWYKTWSGLKPVMQARFIDEIRTYNFKHCEQEPRIVLLNWVKKKSDDTKPGVVKKAKNWRKIALKLLEEE